MASQAPRRSWLLVVGAGLALVVAVAVVVVLVQRTGSTRVCNGAARLCDLRLDEVALATTHNSMNAADDGFLYPDQQHGIAAQLEAGVRGFLVDAYRGSVRPVGDDSVVYTDLDRSRLETAIKAVTSEASARALELREQAGPPPDDAPADVYLCHEFCELGAVRFADVAEELRDFLDDHPGEVVVMIVQDELAAADLLPVLEDGGLDPFLATLDPDQPLPTLGSMVDSGQRLVVGLENGDLGPQIPNVYDGGLVQEVPYDYDTWTSSRVLRRADGTAGRTTRRCSCSTTGSPRSRRRPRPTRTPRRSCSREPSAARPSAASRSTSSPWTTTTPATSSRSSTPSTT